MTERVTADDRGKAVIDANGDHIGTVEDVRDGIALVDTRAAIDPTATRALGWLEESDVAPLRTQVIDTIDDRSIHLRSNL